MSDSEIKNIMETNSFKTLKNIVSSAIGMRIQPHQFRNMYNRLNSAGKVDNIMRDNIIIAMYEYLEQKEELNLLANSKKGIEQNTQK